MLTKTLVAYKTQLYIRRKEDIRCKKVIHPQSMKIQMNENSTQFIRKSHKTLCFQYQYLYPRVWAQWLSRVRLFVTPKDCSPPGSSVYGILQARILEWVSISSSRGSSDPGIEPTSPVSPVLGGRFLTTGPPQKSSLSRSVPISIYLSIKRTII